ncbi:MAG: sigma-54-dependent transcriptional regulator [Planctomycetota bacterium]|jgi:DNA-binding NtrC family response regulator
MTQPAAAARVLLVDDDDTFRQVLSQELSRRGHDVSTAATGRAALRKAQGEEIDVIFLDLRLPDIEGLEVLKELRAKEIAAGVVVLTGHGTIDTAIQAIRLGAYDYLEKPCPVAKVELAIRKTLEHQQLLTRQRVLQDGFTPPDVRTGLIGTSPAFRKVCETAERIARADGAALILGETGVGKEKIATLLHAESPRRDAPFVVVDCAALDEELLGNELFGHEKGAFTGATRQKHGLFEVANGGSLFLDEVGDTTPEIQAKLLRVLETGRFRRLGGTREVGVDVRIISATNRDLRQAVSRGRFRRDLYYRLSSFTIEIPPLRSRREDITALVEYYTTRLNRRFSLSCRFSKAAKAVLLKHDWPGNVRELIHGMEQAMVLSDHELIQPADLPASVRASADASDATDAGDSIPSLDDVKRRHVLAVVEKAGGNRAQAARILGISERNLYRLLTQYGWVAPATKQDAGKDAAS